jgi:hypothetical protein
MPIGCALRADPHVYHAADHLDAALAVHQRAVAGAEELVRHQILGSLNALPNIRIASSGVMFSGISGALLERPDPDSREG